ncbi:MAG: hypothetical protein K6F23_15950 [Solobacterium sp.]|nr:hypothetical protein [Solobacterium sp.]
MNYLISLVLLTVALVMQAIALKQVLSQVDGLLKRETAQDDITAHLAHTLADVRKQVDGLDSRIVVLDAASRGNAREIQKVKVFAYRQSTMQKEADDAEA